MANSVSNGLSFIDGEFMCEILSWLSVKSLTRFKCVCKTWKVLIEEDPYFIDLHLTRSKTRPSVFIAYRTPADKTLYWMAADGNRYPIPYRTLLMTANLREDRGRTDIQAITTDSLRFNTVLGPLNGLICFVDKYEHHYAVCLYNVSTRDVTPWILSNEEQKYIYRQASHHFGCDPITNEHKVIFIQQLMRKGTKTYKVVCEVLTVGDNSWRRIDEVPTRFNFILGSISVNGSVYWIAYEDMRSLDNIQHDLIYLMAFDAGREKFREITVPNFVLDQECGDNYEYFSRSTLLEVDGNVALAHILSDHHTVNLWMFHDTKNISHRKSTSDKCWKKVTVILPFPWDENLSLNFHKIAGLGCLADHMTLKFWEQDPTTLKSSVAYYSYNLRKKTLTRIDDVGGTPSSYRHTTLYPILYRTFAESLLPVQKKHVRSTRAGKL